MAAASSSSSQENYEVFLSFRGKDTRSGFTGHLYHALCQKHILTYKDDQNLESGHKITEIMEAIRESKICIIVFSKHFASSTWCLDEVVRILQCKRDRSDAIIPIFYGIEPSIVRKQELSYADAFTKHQQRFKDSMDKVQQWRDALKEVVGLSGYDSKNIRPEYKLIEKIVEDILLKLSKYLSTNDHFKRHLIGIEKPMGEIEQLLCIRTMDVRIIGFYGMGGIGKTTLARAVFRNFYCHFENYCFLNDVREEFERYGINHLRERLLFELFKDKTIPSLESIHIQDRFRRAKVFIVLDDLDSIFQLNKLLPKEYEFGVGSRIIVTTRDAQMLKSRTNNLYEVKSLNHLEALKLFRLHAFGQNSDFAGYETLSDSVANYASGNPLALEVLGSSLHSKTIKEWESALDKLKIDPNKDIQKVLRISYDGLGDKRIQDIFLDIACFFYGEVDRRYVENILHRNEHSDATIGISILIDKCLIIEYQNRMFMHDLLRQMGQAIVCKENKEPENRSRLWIAKDVCHVLEKNTGSSTIEGILLNQSELQKDVKVRPTAFSNMYHLRFLRMHRDGRFDHEGIPWEKRRWLPYQRNQMCKKMYLPSEGIEYLSDELRYLQWDSYPSKYLPSNFSPENLVELVMRESQLVELPWNEDEPIGKLKKMDLSYSEHLLQVQNLCGAINLRSINLRGCTSLVQVPSCFKNLDKLRHLELSDCKNLKDGIENLPLKLRDLSLSGTAIEVLPLSFGLLRLDSLDLSDCRNLEDIQNIWMGVVELNLGGTSIKTLLESIWKMRNSEWLSHFGCRNPETLPEVSDCLSSSLWSLGIGGCTRLKSVPDLPSPLMYLYTRNCASLETISSGRHPQYELAIHGSCDFKNFLKLDQHTRNNIIADSLHRSISYVQDLSNLEAVYPGNEIPEWFSHQTTDDGNLIHIQLLPNWFHINDSRFKFVYCVVLERKNHPKSGPDANLQFEFNFKTNNNSDDRLYDYNGCRIALYGWQDTIYPDHVFIRYEEIDLKGVFGAAWSSVCSNVTEASCRVFIEGEGIKKFGLEILNKWGTSKNKGPFKLLNGRGSSKRRFDECSMEDNDEDPDIEFQELVTLKVMKIIHLLIYLIGLYFVLLTYILCKAKKNYMLGKQQRLSVGFDIFWNNDYV